MTEHREGGERKSAEELRRRAVEIVRNARSAEDLAAHADELADYFEFGWYRSDPPSP